MLFSHFHISQIFHFHRDLLTHLLHAHQFHSRQFNSHSSFLFSSLRSPTHSLSSSQLLFHSLSTSQISSMASISPILSLHLVFSLLLFTYPVLSDHSPAHSPSQPPLHPADEISPPPATPYAAPSPAPSFSSPPAPPPSDLAPKSSSPAPSPVDKSPSPSPSPAPVADGGDVKRETQPNAADLDSKDESSGGMSRGQKAGVAVGVIAGACIVGIGAVVYKKRQQNIERSQYGYAARREIL